MEFPPFLLKGQPDIRRLAVVLYFSKQGFPELHVYFVLSQDMLHLNNHSKGGREWGCYRPGDWSEIVASQAHLEGSWAGSY